MNVRVVGIDQRLTFGQQGGVENHLIIELPSGVEVRAPISLDIVKQLLDANAENPPSPPPPVASALPPLPPPPPPTHVTETPAASPPAFSESLLEENVSAEEVANMDLNEGLLAWSELPDDVLSPAMKAAFFKLGLEPNLSPAAIRSIEEDIMQKFGEEEWRETLGDQAEAMMPKKDVPPPVAQPAPIRVPAPTQPQVQWADGSPIVSGSSRSRTVPKNDLGYPVLSDGTVDPGEVAGGPDADEDGVGQL